MLGHRIKLIDLRWKKAIVGYTLLMQSASLKFKIPGLYFKLSAMGRLALPSTVSIASHRFQVRVHSIHPPGRFDFPFESATVGRTRIRPVMELRGMLNIKS